MDNEGARRKQAGLTLGMLFLGLPLALAIVVAVSADQLLRHKFRQEFTRTADQARRALAPFLRERALLAQDPFFKGRHEGGDAGSYLNPRVSWQGAPTKGELGVGPEARKAIDNLGENWAAKGRGADRPRLDGSWMRRLHEFGYWDLTNDGPLASGTYPVLNWPEPVSGALIYWAKIRLMQGLDGECDLREAVEDVRHLAWLVYSTESTFGGYSVNLLGLERRACEVAEAEGRPVRDWAPMPKEQLERFRFVFLSTLAFAQAATPQSALDSVFAPADDSIFRCGGLLSATEKAETLRVLGAGEFEDFVRQVDDQVSARVGCRFTLAKAYRERTDSSALLRGVLGNTGLEVVCRYTPKAYCQNLTRLYLAPLGFGFPALPSPVLSPAPPDAGP